MNGAAHLQTPAWLLRGLHSVPGRLVLRGGRLAFVAEGGGSCWPSQLRRLEADAAAPGLAARLLRDERAAVFDVPLGEIGAVRFPWIQFGGGLVLTIRGARFRLGFDRPVHTQPGPYEPIGLMREVARARAAGRAWRAALLSPCPAPRPDPNAPRA